ncbi:MAG: helix-turn-helix transcriptional regulator [Thermomicrobiales bacterium]|nr:helix-turn-helix transcriptional regulator [Thermomicrobiales bacterium]
MPGYGQFCPVAKAAEVFAERWTPLIMREILLGSSHFNELERGLPHISRSVLAQRLKSLERDGLIERRADGSGRNTTYLPTAAGRDLFDVIHLLGVWGARWMNRDVREEDVDVDLLLWDMHRRINLDQLPAHRVVIQFQFTGMSSKRYWLVLLPTEAAVCVTDPGFDVDIYATADTMALHRVWVGHLPFPTALASGAVQLEGRRDLVRLFPSWFQLSMFSHVAPAAAD